MSENTGTYAFGTFEDNEAELARLKAQASIGLRAERKMWGEIGLCDGNEVLDLGCGPGLVAMELAKLVPNGQVIGADLNEALLQEAEALRRMSGAANLRFEKHDAYELGFADASFDFVHCRFLFQHVEDPARALAEIRRVLRPGGRVCIVDIDDQFLTIHPEPDGFAALSDCAVDAQRWRKGNRRIGRELFGLLKEAGLASARTLVHVATTDEWGRRAFLDITTRFKKDQILASPEHSARLDIDACLERIYTFADDPRGWGAIGIFIGVAMRE